MSVGLTVGVGLGLGVSVGVGVSAGVGVSVGMAGGVWVNVGVGVSVAVRVGRKVTVKVGGDKVDNNAALTVCWLSLSIRANKPPTRKALMLFAKHLARAEGIEVYPQTNKIIRLPFGRYQECIDRPPIDLGWNWETMMREFLALRPYNITRFPKAQQEDLKKAQKAPKRILTPGNLSMVNDAGLHLAYGLRCCFSISMMVFLASSAIWCFG